MSTRSLRAAPACLAAALTLAGCLLDEQDCGEGFVVVGSRCVPAAAAPDGSVPPPSLGLDAGGGADRGAPPSPPPEGWGAYSIVALLDQTPDEIRRADPEASGPEIDALLAVPSVGEFRQAFGVGHRVLENPRGNGIDLLGPPDGRAVSLGALGGRVFVELQLTRPLQSGDAVGIVPGDPPGQPEEAFSLFLCRAPLSAMEGCRKAGEGNELDPFVTLP